MCSWTLNIEMKYENVEKLAGFKHMNRAESRHAYVCRCVRKVVKDPDLIKQLSDEEYQWILKQVDRWTHGEPLHDFDDTLADCVVLARKDRVDKLVSNAEKSVPKSKRKIHSHFQVGDYWLTQSEFCALIVIECLDQGKTQKEAVASITARGIPYSTAISTVKAQYTILRMLGHAKEVDLIPQVDSFLDQVDLGEDKKSRLK